MCGLGEGPALPLQIVPDLGGIGQGRHDPQETPTRRAAAEVGGTHPGEQRRPPQAMAAGRSARIAVRRESISGSGETTAVAHTIETEHD